MIPVLTESQKHRREVMAQARAMCEAAGCVTKLAALGVLIIVEPEHGDPQAEQLLLAATEPNKG